MPERNGAYLISRLKGGTIHGFLRGQGKVYLITRSPYEIVRGVCKAYSFIVQGNRTRISITCTLRATAGSVLAK